MKNKEILTFGNTEVNEFYHHKTYFLRDVDIKLLIVIQIKQEAVFRDMFLSVILQIL